MFHFTCSCGAELLFPLIMDFAHEVLCPKCLECFTIVVAHTEE